MDVRVVGVAAVLLSGGFGWSQQGDLDVTPRSGGPGTTVTVSQTVNPTCGTFTVSFDAEVMGTDDASDGHPAVTFRIPDDAQGGEHTIRAICRRGGGGGGSAAFTVETPETTTTVVPTSEEPPETTTTESDVPTTGTTEPVGPVPQNIEECEAQAQDADAHLAYEPERTMVVGRKYEVTAAVSLDEVPSDVTFEASTTVVTIDGVRCTVRAGLTGPDFDITERSSAKQSFVGTRTLVWIWDVRPRHDGDDLELSLSLTATIFEAGRDVDGPTKLHEAIIDVDTVSRSAWARFGDGVNDFLHDPIVAGIIGAIVTAVLLALGPRTYRKVREGVDRRRAARANAAASARPPE